MSLRVWLPLMGDLHNQGASEYTVTSSDAVIVNNGKIGKCMKIVSNTGLGFIPDFNTQGLSFGGWFKFNQSEIAAAVDGLSYTSTASTPTGNLLGNNSYGGIALIWAGNNHYTSGNFSNIHVYAYLRTGSASQTTTNMPIDFDTWTHIMLTWSPDTRILAVYKNGELYNSKTVGAFSNGVSRALTLNYKAIAGGNGPSANIPIYCNDVRIYDHCLSAAEVKEIAQGLVLHYKLDASSEEKITTVLSTNVYSYPTFNTSTASGGWNHWGPSGHSGSYGQNTDKKYIYNKNNTYSHWITEDAGTGKYYLLYQSPAFEGGYRSLQAIIKEENGLPITKSICYPDWNARNGGVPNYKWTTIKSLGDGFYYCCCEGISQDGSNDLIGIIVQPGYKIYVSECYLENNTETCSPIFTCSSNIVQDSSGYNNYATINSAIQLSSDTPRYTSASYFGVYNTPNAILSNASILPALNNCTITWWGKYDTTKTLLLTGQSTSHYIGASNNNNYYHGNAGSPVMYKDGVSGTYKCAADGWHFFALTGVNISTWTTLKINGYGGGWPLNGYISDFRIYCTPLLDSDIKLLYNSSMRVDNLQNIHTFELNENGTNKLTKTGILYDNIVEPYLTLPDGSNWKLLLYHYVDGGNNLFTKTNATYCNDFGLYSRLKDINNYTYDGKYEFYVVQDGIEYRWTQTSQPTASSIAGLTTVSGYTDPVNGLAKANQSKTYIGYGSWWGACGCWTKYSINGKTGIPGFGSHDADGICTKYLVLYARIDKPHASLIDLSSEANEFIER